MLAACTIVSRNYLHYARTLCDSFLSIHPGSAFYVLVVDRPDQNAVVEGERFTTIWVEDLGIPDFASIAFKFNILELNTSVKPSLLKWILDKCGAERVIYLDPDIFVYSTLDDIDRVLQEKDVVLTPHILGPISDKSRPAERDFLLSGVFNLGFIGVSNGPGARAFLDWWESRCLEFGFGEQRSGLFVDQKWIDLAPCLFPGVEIVRDPGYNVAYWNFHERRIDHVDGRLLVNGSSDLRFFHFSGIDLDDVEQVSKYQDRTLLRDRSDLRPLFDDYRRSVIANGYAGSVSARYAFGFFSDGTQINELTRRVYAASLDKFVGVDPFDSGGAFFSFAREHGLLSTARTGASGSRQVADPNDFRFRLIHGAMRLALRVLGADRYTLLMRYLAHVSILRNQRPLFWRD